ncbi:MAG: lamin tail domain-containing protein, partial [Verrucomicrobia bacterium]|nr:lamin tail domain-containing protein [Verrucomicrobiota bacterium]
DQSPLIVRGTSPFNLTSIRVNGIIYQPNWTDTTEWELAIPLKREQTVLNFEGVDSAGISVGQAPQSMTVVFNGISSQLLPDLVFSEWMAVNNSTLKDPSDGNFDDWFEIRNRHDEPIDLSGFTLTDDLSNPSKWTFPEDSNIPPNGYLLIWADGDPMQSTPGESPHVNFKLAGQGEQLGLFDPQGNLIDSVQYPEQTADISMGRPSSQSVDQEFVFLTKPTPGLANPLETDLAPPIRIAISHQADSDTLSLAWDPNPGMFFQLQFKPNLDSTSSWENLRQPSLGQQITIAIDPDSAAEQNQGFYRITQGSEKID